ncbi:flagellar hook-basal body complex protein [Enterovibrio baiacu]|uniref:flagellar hook-basal body complex protein n=1 Tax=Enterovibrio baiacu TaxID=2491023 RepID=UPI001012A787|nr:flagellar hook-basal body complex protein [Enterovibrio baiacu]MBE1277696.1 flagellar hook basal-body protein [Enterovibrio baiacu]
MENVSEIVASSITRNLDALERISNNTQNVTTVGFKSRLHGQSSESTSMATSIDMSQGELRQTNRSLDLAINGSAWFVLKQGDSLYLSRNGQFRLTGNGQVIDGKGRILQGQNGDVFLDSSNVSISGSGEISDLNGALDQLLLVSPSAMTKGQYIGGEWHVNPSTTLDFDASSTVLQGYLEQSNVDPSTEVLEMMSARRHVETMQKTIVAYNETLGKAISELGK